MTTTMIKERCTDTQRMELRSYVQLAGEVIAQYWPMRTFIHHNPLHGSESLPFEQAVQHGEHLFGGRGYLPYEQYRRYVRTGRIKPEDVRAALEPLTFDKHIVFAGQRLSHLDVLTAALVEGVTDVQTDGVSSHQDEHAAAIETVRTWLQSAVTIDPVEDPRTAPERPSRETLSAWCDRTVGTTLVDSINRELIKWCSAFLDEGEASWTMPGREQTLYRTWKSLAARDVTFRLIGIKDAAALIAALPDRPEDAVLEHLTHMRIPKAGWEQYLSLHLAALPGWSGYIKWRSQQSGYPWQQAFPADLVKYIAIRLFYERYMVAVTCKTQLSIEGHEEAIRLFMERYPSAYRLRRAWIAGLVEPPLARQVRRLTRPWNRMQHDRWDALGTEYDRRRTLQQQEQSLQQKAHLLVRLARACAIDYRGIETTAPSDCRTLLEWLDGFSAAQQSVAWLTAFEAGHRRAVLEQLTSAQAVSADSADRDSRSLAQVVFCIDVRSEVFRRHFEHLGGYETLGLAGFFGVPLDYQPFGGHYAVSQCPVLLRPKNQVREIPRSYQSTQVEQHKQAAQLSQATHELLHDLKENVVTPYVMVEVIGWLFGLPLFVRTLFPVWYEKVRGWFRRVFFPSLATTLTVEKLARDEAEEMVANEQRAVIREVVRQRFGLRGVALSSTLLDKIRRKSIGNADGINGEVAKALGLSPEAEAAFYQELREQHRISPRGVSAHLDRLTHTGFSIAEQAYFVEAALRLMGLTSNFSRVVLFCAHGSTSQNNPFESALDCGACGGNHGLPNARAIAAMANKSTVRDLLAERGVKIPADTHFFAAQHDTTTDEVRIVDLEDVPTTHRKDLQRLIGDLHLAGEQAALERAGALQQPTSGEPQIARQSAKRRSEDWAEVRPEWGLSKNSLMVIGRRSLTQQIDLRGRSFLHSYDHQQDLSGKLLETIMTAPLVVAQWINMEHYFSTVDNEVYGSGSKVYHNVVGRLGVMSGVWSDLRIGLPAQTVLNGSEPYHEPMRLLAVIEAPRERIQGVIDRQPLLDQLFNLGWVTLVALDPRDRHCYRFDRKGGWVKETLNRGGTTDVWAVIAPHEGNQDRRAGRSVEVCH